MKDYLLKTKAWAAVEAQKILKRVSQSGQKSIVLETGYGPSGLPHIGTFGEVSRTSMIMFSLRQMTDLPVKLLAFSDDLDGLRKVPTNVPNQDLLALHLEKPLTQVPDPFGTHSSFGEHNNAMLQQFLDKFGFEYEFCSSTSYYQRGVFDEYLLKILNLHEEVCDIVCPTLGAERRATYSPFLPIEAETGKVLQAKVVATNPKEGTITYLAPDGSHKTTLVTGGRVKLQWKVDWGMRWCALGVDYEMYGKDLISSFELSQKVCKLLGCRPPINYVYEHFLDDLGQKISKSKGNGLSLEEWLTYAPPESLSTFMFHKPQTAKRLYFDVIPRYVDEWLRHLVSYNAESENSKRVANPLYYIYKGKVPLITDYINFALILNLVTVVPSADQDQIWHFLDQYKKLDGANRELINSLIPYAIKYSEDFVKPQLKYLILTEEARKLIESLKDLVLASKTDTSAEELQAGIFQIGKSHGMPLPQWFALIYQALLGTKEGPKVGSFFKLIGKDNALELINAALAR